MNDTPICPCESPEHPQAISNPPGQDAIAYRVGHYSTFRQALLRPLKDTEGQPQEMELKNWNPSAKGDLALQMVEWWAYLADILTFYNERVANESYLRTADLTESVRRLIRLLGYRPRPGIGATGVVAALMNARTPFTLPPGFQLQSKPGPGKQPQVFELNAATPVSFPDAVEADPAPDSTLLADETEPFKGKSNSVLLKGTITAAKVGDRLLILNRFHTPYALGTVAEVRQEKDPRGSVNTRVRFSESFPDLAGARATDYRLAKSLLFAHLWPYPAGPGFVIDTPKTTVQLEAITRGIKVGDPILFEILNASPNPQLVSVTAYAEAVWYANPSGPDPSQPPESANIPPIPIPHTQLSIQPALTGIADSAEGRAQVLVRHAWQDVGELLETPARSLIAVPATLIALPPAVFPPGNNLPVLLEDADGQGVRATGSVSSEGKSLQLTDLPEPPVALTPPLRVLFDLLPVSRGKTVVNEILGSGDASLAGQEFILQKSPLTYLPSPDSFLSDSYKSTLRVWVNGVEWLEAPGFYGQMADGRIFVTAEDESNRTHVLFGDGENGARLPSGSNNVVASYRHESGAETPPADTLTVIQQPHPGLKAVRNPVAAGGGADPDPPAQIRRYAPQSVLAFGRAVSAGDYETIAAQTPGVARARAYWAFDPEAQRTSVTVYVGDDVNAVAAARAALARAGDPNRPVLVKQALLLPVSVNLSLRIDPRFVPAHVTAAATAALTDPNTGLFGIKVIRIGQGIFRSQIFGACLSVPGVLAVPGFQFVVASKEDKSARYDPGQGGFFQLQNHNLSILPEIARDAS